MASELSSDLTVRIEPHEMVRYVHSLMTTGQSDSQMVAPELLAQRQWGGDAVRARAAQLRWSALNRAFGDERLSSWTAFRQRNQIHVPAALIAAAGVATLTVAEDEVVFDIPTLLDATLQLCEPVGHA